MASWVGLVEAGRVELVDAVGVALHQRVEGERLPAGRLLVRLAVAVEGEHLVLEGVGQLVDQGDGQPRRHLRPPHDDPLLAAVVVGEGAGVGEVVGGVDEAGVAGEDAQGPQLALELLDLLRLLLGQRPLVGAGALGVLLRREEVDGDGVVEHRPPLPLHEVDQVEHPGVPLRRDVVLPVAHDGGGDPGGQDHDHRHGRDPLQRAGTTGHANLRLLAGARFRRPSSIGAPTGVPEPRPSAPGRR